MGLIGGIIELFFGGGRNVLRETAAVFRENADSAAQRDADARAQAMVQFGAEFAVQRQGRFDRFIDGLNRLPRPALALGTLGLFVSAMVDPIWFAARMQGIALVPEPLWWLLGVIVSFYFGARHQMKSQEFQRSLAETAARTPQVVANIAAIREFRHDTPGAADPGPDVRLAAETAHPEDNAALEHWRGLRQT
ncbi:holin family protein [Ruegeria marina]|uniref:Holin of 3TMs, for gene-transfer release n=1 Tax=Ruegeria marina TaxID=639004 RepID=A0A1G6XLW7_9RHOB|nr:holin family protein [Ruegeria marina]SDD79224.1 Holin of 3TMs, for gene-transfer release [Ruegeria marina]